MAAISKLSGVHINKEMCRQTNSKQGNRLYSCNAAPKNVTALLRWRFMKCFWCPVPQIYLEDNRSDLSHKSGLCVQVFTAEHIVCGRIPSLVNPVCVIMRWRRSLFVCQSEELAVRGGRVCLPALSFHYVQLAGGVHVVDLFTSLTVNKCTLNACVVFPWLTLCLCFRVFSESQQGRRSWRSWRRRSIVPPHNWRSSTLTHMLLLVPITPLLYLNSFLF